MDDWRHQFRAERQLLGVRRFRVALRRLVPMLSAAKYSDANRPDVSLQGARRSARMVASTDSGDSSTDCAVQKDASLRRH